MQKLLKITVYGKVQNVGFRHFVKKNALSLSLTGFVQNRNNKTVYIEVQGEDTSLQKFIKYCWQGPLNAKVSDITITDGSLKDYTVFEIKSSTT